MLYSFHGMMARAFQPYSIVSGGMVTFYWYSLGQRTGWDEFEAKKYKN